MNFLFWCEFPNRVDFKKLHELLKENNLKLNIGVACKSKEDFEEKRKIISKYDTLNLVRAWPTLPKSLGYWFSSFSSKKAIDSLDQYVGIPIKIDVEPPIPKLKNYTSNPIKMQLWFWNHFFRKGRNHKYFTQKIRNLSKTTNIMLSTFSFPKLISERHGVVFEQNISYNYIYYSSFIPSPLKPLYRLYMRKIIKKRLSFNPNTSFAVGLLTPGIFHNEPCYSSPKQLKEDINFLKKHGVKNIVVFRLGSLLELKDPNSWLKVIKESV